MKNRKPQRIQSVSDVVNPAYAGRVTINPPARMKLSLNLSELQEVLSVEGYNFVTNERFLWVNRNVFISTSGQIIYVYCMNFAEGVDNKDWICSCAGVINGEESPVDMEDVIQYANGGNNPF